MARLIKKRDLVLGKSPGSIVFIGNQKIEFATLRIIDYNKSSLEELERLHFHDIPDSSLAENIRWLSIYGLHDTELINDIGGYFTIHPLILEDIVNTGQRPKIEEYDDHVFVVIKIVRFNAEEERVNSDQLSLLVGPDYLLSFHEQPVDVFKPLRDRLRKPNSRLRENNVGYLMYAILDTVVDNYLAAIESLGSRIEDLEDMVLEDPDPEVLDRITKYKREINFLRKTIHPARDLVMRMSRLETGLILDPVVPFLKDLQDHMTQAEESLETYREMLTDQLNTYHTTVSYKLNDIMKVLTIFAAIFIPLTFIAGIYGTNFQYLPELQFKYSYFVFWAILILVALGMLRYFKKKGWL